MAPKTRASISSQQENKTAELPRPLCGYKGRGYCGQVCRSKMETYKEARRLLDERDLEQSFKFFTDFINSERAQNRPERREELVDAYNSRGHIRYLWVDFDEAISDYSEAIELDPKLAVAYYNRGQIHYRLGMTVKSF